MVLHTPSAAPPEKDSAPRDWTGYWVGRCAGTGAIRTNDIDWDCEGSRIHGKGAKERDLPLDQCFANPLRKHLTSNPGLVYLFEGRKKGHPYPRRTLQKIYDNACAKAGIQRKGGIHSLRHTLRPGSAQAYATHLLEQGTSIVKIQALLGHADVKTKQIYTHVSKEELAKIRSPLASLKPNKDDSSA
jgi:integrase/recombinase XerD